MWMPQLLKNMRQEECPALVAAVGMGIAGVVGTFASTATPGLRVFMACIGTAGFASIYPLLHRSSEKRHEDAQHRAFMRRGCEIRARMETDRIIARHRNLATTDMNEIQTSVENYVQHRLALFDAYPGSCMTQP